MKIEITFTRSDVESVRDLVENMKGHKFVVDRRGRNVDRTNIDLSREAIWRTHLGCLLTSHQKSGKGSAVERFIESEPPLLPLTLCEDSGDIANLAQTKLSRSGGIWRAAVISKQIAHNFGVLRDGGWQNLEAWLSPLKQAPQSKETERACATEVDALLTGFGPKQSRNFLQWLGLTQYETPIDSRIVRWLRTLGDSTCLSLLCPTALAEIDYYCCIMDTIQELCAEAEVLPCIFDASVFASFEKA